MSKPKTAGQHNYPLTGDTTFTAVTATVGSTTMASGMAYQAELERGIKIKDAIMQTLAKQVGKPVDIHTLAAEIYEKLRGLSL